jgi:hypothetical protein
MAWLAPRNVYDWVLIVVTCVLFSLIGYWSIVDRQPVGESASEVLTPIVPQGGTFTIQYTVKWNGSCKVSGYRFVIDSAGQQYTVAPDQRLVTPSDAPEFVINIPIPSSAKPGPAIYRATILYQCNPLQYIFPLERQIPDRHFEISLPGPQSSQSTLDCVGEKPIFVRAFCRRR